MRESFVDDLLKHLCLIFFDHFLASGFHVVLRFQLRLQISLVDHFASYFLSISYEVMRGEVALYPPHFHQNVVLSDTIFVHEVFLLDIIAHQCIEIFYIFLDLLVADYLACPGFFD